MIKAFINIPYKKIGVLSVFEKVIQRNGKKSNFCVSRTTFETQKFKFCMQKLFLENACLSTKFVLVLKKKQKIFGAISKLLRKIFVDAIKKMLVIKFRYMEIV